MQDLQRQVASEYVPCSLDTYNVNQIDGVRDMARPATVRLRPNPDRGNDKIRVSSSTPRLGQSLDQVTAPGSRARKFEPWELRRNLFPYNSPDARTPVPSKAPLSARIRVAISDLATKACVRSLRRMRFLFTLHRNLPRNDAAQRTNRDRRCMFQV